MFWTQGEVISRVVCYIDITFSFNLPYSQEVDLLGLHRQPGESSLWYKQHQENYKCLAKRMSGSGLFGFEV